MSAATTELLTEAWAGLAGRRVVLVATGSLSAAHLPYWLTWLQGLEDGPELRVLLTRSATRMVSPTVVAAMTGAPPALDAWEDPRVEAGRAVHVELAEWADGFVVHPCTLSYLGRIAQGLADTPVQLALQVSPAPAVLCPALPPGGLDSWAYRRHVAALEERPDTVVVPPTSGLSAATGRDDGLPPAHFPLAVAALGHSLLGRG